MKKLNRLMLLLCFVFVATGCEILGRTGDFERNNTIPTTGLVMDSIQHEIAENYNMKVINGIVSDATTEKPIYKLMDILSETDTEFFPSAKHFAIEGIIGGYILEPLDSTGSSELVIVIEMEDSTLTDEVYTAMQKVLSDQFAYWNDRVFSQKELVRNNAIVTQGHFFLYVTSKQKDDIITAFQEAVN